MFRYKHLEWENSSAHSIPVRGPATAGINAGDRLNGFNVTNNVDDIKNLVSMTNCGVPGLFVYQVDLGPCKQSTSLYLLLFPNKTI